MKISENKDNIYKFRINTILLKTGVQINPGRINVFVGANNCGKTRLLKELYEYTIGKIGKKILLTSLSIPVPKTWEEFSGNCHFEVLDMSEGKAIQHISPTLHTEPSLEHFGYDLVREINDLLKQSSNWDFLRQRLGGSLITYLDTDNRLNLAKSKQANINSNGPENLLEVLYKAESESTNKLNSYCWQIFKKKVFLSPYNLGKVELKVGGDFSDMPSDPQDARDRLTNVSGLDEQGDGMRSAIGIIAALCAVKKPIVLLDEPEAFLHPPQALQLGAVIDELIDSSQQIFIATHSANFLRGLLSKTQDINIIHIDRAADDKITVNVLDSITLNHIITNPLLSSSRVLEGLFYKGVVVTEADADVAFYQRAFQMVGAADEIHFINAHNKQTLKKVITPYQKLGIKFALIADADILKEKHDIDDILEIAGNTELKERVFNYRENIVKFFTDQSRLNVLFELREKIRKFASEKLITEIPEPEFVDEILFKTRKQLKELREETDLFQDLKKKGRYALDEANRALFDKLWEDCAGVGLFIVPVGELESWLEDYDIPRKLNKAKWITEALQKLYEIGYEEDKELWKFINKLQKYLTS